jgi:putative tryptophan/tyrosine transport system substrate-binding protein
MRKPSGVTPGRLFFSVKGVETERAVGDSRHDRSHHTCLLALDGVARDLRIEILPFAARSKEEIVQAIDAMKARLVDAVNVLASPILWDFLSLILERLCGSRLPAIWRRPEGAEQGGVICYGSRNDAVFRQCALRVAKLLRGAT